MLHKLKPHMTPLPSTDAETRVAYHVATFFGVGRLRPVPGTLGSLAAIPIGFVIAAAGGPLALAVAALIVTCVGSVAATVYGKKSGSVDDQSIVIDEVAGMWIAAIPASTIPGLWIAAFLLFRFFDIYKPWPASYFDNKKRNGWDVMLDDVIAGIFALCGVAFLAIQIPV